MTSRKIRKFKWRVIGLNVNSAREQTSGTDLMNQLTKDFKYNFIAGDSRASIGSEYLMIVLHGQGDSELPFRLFSWEIGVPGLNLLLLNAPIPFASGYSWYDEPPKKDRQISSLRKKLFRLLDELIIQGWSAKKIFIFGFSQGALVGSDLVLHYREQLAGFIGVSGYFHFYPRWRQRMKPQATPFCLLHGTTDRVLPLQETLYGARKLQTLGVQIDWAESDRGHQMDEAETDRIGTWIKAKCRGDVPGSYSGFHRKVLARKQPAAAKLLSLR